MLCIEGPKGRACCGICKAYDEDLELYIENGRLQVRAVTKSNDDETTFETRGMSHIFGGSEASPAVIDKGTAACNNVETRTKAQRGAMFNFKLVGYVCRSRRSFNNLTIVNRRGVCIAKLAPNKSSVECIVHPAS
jgi:hypothetical protein